MAEAFMQNILHDAGDGSDGDDSSMIVAGGLGHRDRYTTRACYTLTTGQGD
jgi:hypothetical protein